MNKAKYILLAEVRKLRSKESQKRRDADRIGIEADEIEERIKDLKD